MGFPTHARGFFSQLYSSSLGTIDHIPGGGLCTDGPGGVAFWLARRPSNGGCPGQIVAILCHVALIVTSVFMLPSYVVFPIGRKISVPSRALVRCALLS